MRILEKMPRDTQYSSREEPAFTTEVAASWWPRYSILLDAVMAHKQRVIFAMLRLAVGVEVDRLVPVVLNMALADRDAAPGLRAMLMFRTLADLEFERASSLATLFRVNNAATKYMTAWSRKCGAAFLASVVGPALRLIQAEPEMMEVDPTRAEGDGEDKDAIVKEHILRMESVAAQVLVNLAVALERGECPREMRSMARYLWTGAKKRFPDEKNASYIAVAGFFFLRFVNPALVAPEALNLTLETVTPPMRRGFILLSKVLQNLANGQPFGTKERHMTVLNPFLERNRKEMRRILKTIAAPLPQGEDFVAPKGFRREKSVGKLLQDAEPGTPVLHDYGKELPERTDGPVSPPRGRADSLLVPVKARTRKRSIVNAITGGKAAKAAEDEPVPAPSAPPPGFNKGRRGSVSKAIRNLMDKRSGTASKIPVKSLPQVLSPRMENGLSFREVVEVHNVLGREAKRLLSVARDDAASTQAIEDALTIVEDLGPPPAPSPNLSRRADGRIVSRMGVIKVDSSAL